LELPWSCATAPGLLNVINLPAIETPLRILQGWKTYLLKGNRGEGAGKLQLTFEIESVEARDRYFPRPGPGGESEEFRQFQEQHPEATAASEKYTGFLVEPHSWTDYLVVGAPSS
jgi:hypothetical protein